MTPAILGPLDLAAEGRQLLREGATAGVWPRAAAVLTRQSIEVSMRQLWDLRAYGLQATSARCQLLCLRVLLGDPALAGRAAVAYDGLSRALHHHPYELAPTSGELLDWATTAWDLGEAVARAHAGRRPQGPGG